ncbi:MAG: polymorphic toxin type 23 domain-containing protein [Lentimicrobium sp.]|nr:polymorphic toxin type 23 domain-containing protein [Lentimicrobium sp.]
MRLFPYIESTHTIEKDITTNGFVKTTHADFTYDDFGNMLSTVVLIDPAEKEITAVASDYKHQTTTNYQYYSPDLTNWLVGKPEKITTQTRFLNEAKDGATQVLIYYPADHSSFPFIKEKQTFPSNILNGNLATSELFTYDDFGNIETITLSAPNSQPQLETRTSSKIFGAEYHHRFPTTSTNALLNTASATYDPVYGTLKTSTGPNELTSQFESNPLGTFSKTIAPDGSITITVSRWANGNEHAPANALYYTWQQTSGSPEVMVFYHKTGAELRSVTFGFDGNPVYIDKIYNNKGLLHKESLPYKKGTTPLYTEYLYDNYNRLIEVIAPDDTKTTTSYAANEVNVTVVNGNITRTSKKKYNAAGWLEESTDNSGSVVKNEYYCNGNLKKSYIVGQPATAVSLEYDARGNRSLLDDPNYGQMVTVYNAYGELVTQTNPQGQTTTFSYDKLGRKISETGGTEGNIAWNYSVAQGKIGTLESIVKSNHITNYVYDNLLRITTETETINNVPYATIYTYDELGRPFRTTYPTGVTLQDGYNNYGYHTTVSLESSGKQLWKTEQVNAMGLVTKYRTGNDLETEQTYYPLTSLPYTVQTVKKGNEPVQDIEYKWYGLGNLEYRKKWLNRGNNTSLTESFTYDGLDRLLSAALNGAGTGYHMYDYPPNIPNLGNMTYKYSDGNTIFSNAIYGTNGYGPHAITEVTTANPILTGPRQDIIYNGYDKVKTITEGDHLLSIQYGHHKQRISQHYSNREDDIDKIWAGVCEYITKNGQQYKYTYLSGPLGLFAIHIIKPDGTAEINYIHTDHLGSWNTITDESGNLLQELSFDAWGNRRDPLTWKAFTTVAPEPLFDRGFTGHEHLYAFNLINMNGRFYDPVVGRMLSPDPYMQAPDFSQSFNRYSYCFNNPLRYTDPSGEISFAILWPISCFGTMLIGDAISNIVNDVSDPFGTAWENSTTMWNGINNAVKVNIYKDNNTQVSLGASPLTLGVSASVSHKLDDKMTFSASGGIGIGGWFASGGLNYSDEHVNVGIGVGAGNNHWAWGVNATVDGFGAGYYQTRYGNNISEISGTSNPQSVGGANIFLNDFSIRFENDFLMFNHQDRWRSNGLEFSYMDLSIGTYLYNNDPKNTEGEKAYSLDKESPFWGKNRPGKNNKEFGGWNKGLTYMSPLYFGFKFANNVYRIGYNHHIFQDFTQNGIHKFFPPGRQHFYQDYSEFNYGMYYYQGWYNPYSFWGR